MILFILARYLTMLELLVIAILFLWCHRRPIEIASFLHIVHSLTFRRIRFIDIYFIRIRAILILYRDHWFTFKCIWTAVFHTLTLINTILKRRSFCPKAEFIIVFNLVVSLSGWISLLFDMNMFLLFNLVLFFVHVFLYLYVLNFHLIFTLNCLFDEGLNMSYILLSSTCCSK